MPAPRTHLRVVRAGEHHDIAIAVPAVQVGASAFVAGQGARLYSLDAFRTGRRGPTPPRRAA